MTTNYTCAIIFTKRSNLMPWFEGKYPCASENYDKSIGFQQFKKDCARVRDVQLILLVRYEPGHTYCKIKCPINPLPFRGEFEAVSLRHITELLKREGWTEQQTLPISLLK